MSQSSRMMRTRSGVAVACALAALLAALAFVAPDAAAVKTPLLDFGSFGSDGGQFSSPRGVAINEGGAGGVPAGTIYITDFGNNRVQSFDANGNFVRAWGWNVVEDGKPGDAGAGFEICDTGTGNVAQDCQAGASGGGGGQFNSIQGGLAVNQTSGDVYVLDHGNNRVQQFDATGDFIRTWGRDVTTGGGDVFEICEVATSCKAGLDGGAAGQFAFTGIIAIAGIGVDAGGNVYVLDVGNRRVQKFSSTGGFLRTSGWDVVDTGPGDSPEDRFEICVTAAGDVCKSGTTGVDPECRFSNSSASPGFFATGPGGETYAFDRRDIATLGDNRLYRFSSALDCDQPFSEVIPPVVMAGSDVRDIAVDAADNHLFASKQADTADIYEIDPATGAIATHPSGAPNWIGLEVNSASGRMYGVPNFGSFVRVFAEVGPTAATARPTDVAVAGATLNGSVEPGGKELTECVFEWGETAVYEKSTPCGQSPTAIGAGTGPVPVSAEISGLAPNGTTYHFRLRVANPDGEARGGDLSFVTPDAVITKPATEIANTEATLNGTVNPAGQALIDCRFEYVTRTAFEDSGFSDLSSGGQIACEPPFSSIPPDTSEHPVAARATDLVPRTEYRFRLVVSNAAETTAGEPLSFLTTSQPLVETVGSPLRTTTTAQLSARVSPSTAPTQYRFEYGDQGPCQANPCAQTPWRPLDTEDSVYRFVVEQVDGLAPSTTYHYRVIADNGNPDGHVTGADMTLTTRASDAPLSHGDFPGPPGSDRAWELVSLPDQGGNPVAFAIGIAANGERALYQINGGTPISPTGHRINTNFAERVETGPHEGGWRNLAITPTRDELGEELGGLGVALLPFAFSPDLANVYAKTSTRTWLLQPGAPAQLLAAVGEGVVKVATENGRLLVSSVEALDGDYPDPPPPDVPPFEVNLPQVYEVNSADPPFCANLECELVSLIPGPGGDHPPTCGVDNPPEALILPDGSRYFFKSEGDDCESPGFNSQIYMRNLATGVSTLVSSPPTSGPGCEAFLMKAVAGSLFFVTQSRLDPIDSEPAACETGQGFQPDVDVYRYDLADGGLECVTCVAAIDADVYVPFNSNQAPRTSEFTAIAPDGSRLYFHSSRSLLSGAPETSGGGSLYVLEPASGELRWVAGPGVVFGEGRVGTSAISHDGAAIRFLSDDFFGNPSDKLDALGGSSDNGGTRQLYRYDDRDRSLVCVSCPPDGSEPRGHVEQGDGQTDDRLSDAGGVVFATPSPLLDADQNTAGAGRPASAGSDVYEWRDGRLLLVTDGSTSWPTTTIGDLTVNESPPRVLGIDRSGRNIFFIAAAQYTSDALDGFNRVYVARIGGGFRFPEPPSPCPLEVCQGTPQGAPEEAKPGSRSFSGSGNVSEVRDCGRHARLARRLARRAKRLRAAAARDSDSRHASALRHSARRVGRAAGRRAAVAKRCRDAARDGRRAGR